MDWLKGVTGIRVSKVALRMSVPASRSPAEIVWSGAQGSALLKAPPPHPNMQPTREGGGRWPLRIAINHKIPWIGLWGEEIFSHILTGSLSDWNNLLVYLNLTNWLEQTLEGRRVFWGLIGSRNNIFSISLGLNPTMKQNELHSPKKVRMSFQQKRVLGIIICPWLFGKSWFTARWYRRGMILFMWMSILPLGGRNVKNSVWKFWSLVTI